MENMNNYIIYISKRRTPDDKYGMYWGKVELPDCDEEKAKEKHDMMRILFGDMFVLTMIIKPGVNK